MYSSPDLWSFTVRQGYLPQTIHSDNTTLAVRRYSVRCMDGTTMDTPEKEPHSLKAVLPATGLLTSARQG